MTYFQVPSGSHLVQSQGTKLPSPWPATAEGYRLFVSGDSGDERIGIQLGQRVELQITGGKDCYLVTPQWQTVSGLVGKIGAEAAVAYGNANPGPITFSELVALSDEQKFIVHARSAGATTLSALDSFTRVVKATLQIVVGNFENHPGMRVDLIADVCRGSNPLKIHALQRMLNNNTLFSVDAEGFGVYNNGDNIFNQGATVNKSPDPKIGRMSCGVVARWRSEEIFDNATKTAPQFDWYQFGAVHEPLSGKPTSRKQVKYRSERIETLRLQIVRALNEGAPVRVAVVNSPTAIAPVNGYLVAYAAGGHTVIIVGCSADGMQFLYIDPWGSGSQMEYKGEIAGAKFTGPCLQIGKLTVAYDPDRRVKASDTNKNIIREATDTQGSFTYAADNYLEVVAAPFVVVRR